jgi:hypothetical protein
VPLLVRNLMRFTRLMDTTGNLNCLEGPEFSWGANSNRRGKSSFLGGAIAHSRKHIFFRGGSKPPRNIGVSLAVSSHLQGNDILPWVLFLTAKENTHFLGVIPNHQVNYHFFGGYWIFLEVGSQGNAYKYFGDFNWKNNNPLKVSENPKIWHEIITWLYYLAIKFSNHINKVGPYISYKWIDLSHSYITMLEMYAFANNL